MIAKESGIKVGSILRQDYKDLAGDVCGGYLWEVTAVDDTGVKGNYWDINLSKSYAGSNSSINLRWAVELNTDLWNVIFA